MAFGKIETEGIALSSFNFYFEENITQNRWQQNVADNDLQGDLQLQVK